MAFTIFDDMPGVGAAASSDDRRLLAVIVNGLHAGIVSGFVISQMRYFLDGLVEYTRTHFKGTGMNYRDFFPARAVG